MDKFQLACLFDEDLDYIHRAVIGERRRRAKFRRYYRNKKAERRPPEDQDWVAANSATLLSVPGVNSSPPIQRGPYLEPLVAQDWSSLFVGKFDADRRYYVYAHIDPTKTKFKAPECAGGAYAGRPFYIGKGSGERAYCLKRNQGHGKMLRSLLATGFTADEIVHIVKDGLTEREAFELEAKLIYFFGTLYGKRKASKVYGWLCNLEEPKRPEFVGVMTSLSALRKEVANV